MSSNSKTFTYEEVKKHNKHDDLWVVIHDKVYNLTSFISDVSFICVYLYYIFLFILVKKNWI